MMNGNAMAQDSIKVYAACLRGVEAIPVTVEVAMSNGLPGITIVGMADAAILEARSRIRCAFRSAGYEVPRKKITVNLSPGDLRKSGSGFDLPIAVGILAVSGQIPLGSLNDYLYIGELSLDGDVKEVRGVIAYQLLAQQQHKTLVVSAHQQVLPHQEANTLALKNIALLQMGMRHCRQSSEYVVDLNISETTLDFEDVCGQDLAKRALAIAAVGDLGVLMLGPAGSGKTMLAKRFSSIMEPLDSSELIETMRAYSVAEQDISSLLLGRRPFRSPHHSISSAGMVGGGRPIRPGEVSLAHKGVLFLDEFGEFSNNVLQLLRQPMEEGVVRLARAEGVFEFPCQFQLLAASNPCPCGNLGDDAVKCTCTPQAIDKYQAKLGGPLIDRIDMRFSVRRPDPEVIIAGKTGLSSAALAQWVKKGRTYKTWREAKNNEEDPLESLHLSSEAQDKLTRIAQVNHLTGRGIIRLARIARSIADMNESESVSTAHLLEASSYRGV